jgi:hypothetical protein
MRPERGSRAAEDLAKLLDESEEQARVMSFWLRTCPDHREFKEIAQ